eukprot:gb/GFBE01056957.1/.p1 GENE.gb/GFBE01056957.1/~~gb/GFBE01056957.1/.p1  ORF type:complete len:342 (+),score=67.45 gb/GFBE01056957.1/:1-1026(+)
MAPRGRKAPATSEKLKREEDNSLADQHEVCTDCRNSQARIEDKDDCKKPLPQQMDNAMRATMQLEPHSLRLAQAPDPGPAMAESVTELPWAPSQVTAASSASDTDRRIMSAAASIGGAAGLLLAGPVSGVALGTAAMYATSRDDGAGAAARKAGALYLQVADWAVDRGLQGMRAAGSAADEGCRRLLEKSGSLDLEAACQKAPAPLRGKLKAIVHLAGQASRSAAPRQEPRPEDVARLRERIPPDRVPVICEPSCHANLPAISKKKFAVPGSMLCGEFKYMVHKFVMQGATEGSRAEQTIYIFVDGVMPKTSEKMADLYERLRSEDGFLHVRYCAENTLGC